MQKWSISGLHIDNDSLFMDVFGHYKRRTHLAFQLIRSSDPIVPVRSKSFLSLLSSSHTLTLTARHKTGSRTCEGFFESGGVEARKHGEVRVGSCRRKSCGEFPVIIACRKTERGIEEEERRLRGGFVRSRALARAREVHTSHAPNNRLAQCVLQTLRSSW